VKREHQRGAREGEAPEGAAMLTRRDFVAGAVAASLAVAATLGALALIQPVRGEKEPTVNTADPADTDLVTLSSAHNAPETVERLKALLAQKGIDVFAHIDHAAAATKVGLSLRPTQVLIFGNPKAGTPLMQSQQTIGLDLPLRVLVWEDEAGKVWLTYRRVETLARQHHVTDRDEAVKALDGGLAALAHAAASP
jgi:uncharacterized protein (DUF302 family)